MNPVQVPVKPGTRIHVEVFSDMSRLAERADDWNELVASSVHPNVFLTWEWVSQWWRSFGADKQAHIIAVI